MVYETVSVPADKPIITPEELIDATTEFDNDQLPPTALSDKMEELPTQTLKFPEICAIRFKLNMQVNNKDKNPTKNRFI